MDSNRKHGQTPLPPLVATIAMLGVGVPQAGCADHRLPPNPVPTLANQHAPPEWFDPNLVYDPRKPVDTRVYIKGQVLFDTDRATIKKGSEKVLWQLHDFLVQNQWVTRLRVEGHTDSRADDWHNNELSAKRSLAVCEWLVEHGIDNIRLIAVGFGERKPVGPNETAVGRQENRRTEFHVMEVEGRPFGPPDALDGGQTMNMPSAEELWLRKHPKKVVHPKLAPFHPKGNHIDRFKPPPKKPIDADAVVQAPIGDSPGDAGPIKPDEKKDEKKSGGGDKGGGDKGGGDKGGGGAAPPPETPPPAK